MELFHLVNHFIIGTHRHFLGIITLETFMLLPHIGLIMIFGGMERCIMKHLKKDIVKVILC